MLNTIILMGRLTADPELKTTSTGVEVCSFRIAVDRKFQKQGEEKQADFIPVTVWRQGAVFVNKYFHKGSMIAVEGSLQSRHYEDKDGNKRTTYDVVADRVSFCGSKNESAPSGYNGGDNGTTGGETNPNGAMDIAADDDLPF